MKSTDKAKSKAIRVALNRIWKCPNEIQFSETRNLKTVESSTEELETAQVKDEDCESCPWSG